MLRRRIQSVAAAAALAAAVSVVAPAGGTTFSSRIDSRRCGSGVYSTSASTSCRKTAAQTTSYPKAAYVELDLLIRLNTERIARGLKPLKWDPTLGNSARWWSIIMSVTGMHHSDLTKLFFGKYDQVAENIAWASGPGATAGAVHVMWMKSSGHRANILAPGLDYVGIGVYCSPDGKLWATQQFGRLTTSGPPTPIPAAPALPLVRSDPGSTHC